VAPEDSPGEAYVAEKHESEPGVRGEDTDAAFNRNTSSFTVHLSSQTPSDESLLVAESRRWVEARSAERLVADRNECDDDRTYQADRKESDAGRDAVGKAL